MITIKDIYLSKSQLERKTEFLKSFKKAGKKIGVSDVLIDGLADIVETAFMEGILSERESNEISLN